ncbi:hypothetical protein BC939DRAFT_481239 [Gamsiella multidivaricata]|uniref:uncharacterized protein n=1 Tax=Gamsiella multidivaricata TaxID=101098 RepID=UPI00221EA8F7|nr:uncharacterized protein BC939DRAFT_481239 [Gamsiella multidivaricata]KAI7817371.1 hypothetical protein BC939DRAFT_481239 [Gamsiella multidivaricata]
MPLEVKQPLTYPFPAKKHIVIHEVQKVTREDWSPTIPSDEALGKRVLAKPEFVPASQPDKEDDNLPQDQGGTDEDYERQLAVAQLEIEELRSTLKQMLMTNLRGTLALLGDPSEAAEEQSQPNDKARAGAEPSPSREIAKRKREANDDNSGDKAKARRKSI